MRGIVLADITWSEAVSAFQTHPVALLPIGGGTKEHGFHLPLGTDLLVVDELARRVVEVSPVVLLPSLAYAYYPAFVDWAGSVSIGSQHFAGFVGDIIRSLHRHGVKKFVILDGGVSTHPVLGTLARDLHEELRVSIAVTNILGLGAEVQDEISEQESGGHADEMETSNLLVIRPDLVKMDKAVKEFQKVLPGVIGPTGIRKFTVGGKMTTQSGINGDATLATVEKGEKSLKAMADDIITFIQHFAAAPLP